jgi:hypothetical protein
VLTPEQDRFTTNYYLADGSYGSITTGAYNCSSGGVANLITGWYELPNGQTGNIYQIGILAPNVTVLAMPTPFTSNGIGSAIPVTALGTLISNTTTSQSLTAPITTPTGNTTTWLSSTTQLFVGSTSHVTNVAITPPITSNGLQASAHANIEWLMLVLIAASIAVIMR